MNDKESRRREPEFREVHRPMQMTMPKIISSLALSALVFLAASSVFGLEKRYTINGETAGDQFGDAVAVVDFNADGFDDYIVGAPASDAGGISSGKIYIFFGGLSADDVADMTIIGPDGSLFGAALADAGDVNDDGYPDLIVGAPFYSDIAMRAGAAYLFFGGPTPDTMVDLALFGPGNLDYYGTAVTGGVDFNGDGFDDVAVGAYKVDYGAYTDAGVVSVYFGGSSPDTVTDLILAGTADGERFGYALASGNFNGDNWGDIAVGAYSYDDGRLNLGRVYLFYGNTTPDSIFDYAVGGEIQGSYFGYALAAGNFDDDGFDDLLVGAYGFRIGQAEAGKIYTYEALNTGDTIADFTHTLGRAADDHFGMDVAAGVDIDGDMTADFWAGYPGGDGGVLFSGGSYAVDTTLSGETAGEEFGHAAAMSASYFGPKKPSLIVGAYAYGSYLGRVYIYMQDNSGGNQPPVLAPIGSKTVIADSNLNFDVTADDPDGTTPELYTSPLPSGAIFVDHGDGSGTFEWTPDTAQIGAYPVTFFASDGDLIDSELVTISVISGKVTCGDANADVAINIADAVFIINYIFKGGLVPQPLCRADANDDTGVNLADAVYLINFIFKGGSPPVESCCQ